MGSAAAQQTYRVTFAARVCENYTDIFANLNRNNILESLRDLGPDSQYAPGGQFSGQLVTPAAESIPPQDGCVPLANWRFSLGTGHQVRAVSGPWGSLAIVLNPLTSRVGTIITQAETPLLEGLGNPIAGQQLAGATTITLGQTEVDLARESRLWVQGGTPEDPILAREFGSGGEPEYGFGALRCAGDRVNADNVEYLFFPSGVRHVFCYVLLVKPPPTSGTITIRKVVEGPPQSPAPVFPFNGSLSFDPNGFRLSHNQQQTFYRAGGVSWEVTGGQAAGYEPVGPPSCTAVGPSGGAGSSTSSVTQSSATIHLVPEEHVTCVFVSRPVPPPGGLTIRKLTRGGVGTFGYTITRTGVGAVAHAQATTAQPEVAVDALPSPLSLTAGHYVIHEAAPETPDGVWRRDAVICNGQSRSAALPVEVNVASGEALTCTFENRLELRGSISVAKVTLGGVGTVAFLIQPFAASAFTTTTEEPIEQFRQSATTATEGHPHPAAPLTPADDTTDLPLGYYWIASQPPISAAPGSDASRATTSAVGEWMLVSVEVNGVIVPFTEGAAALQLTPTSPHAHVVFTSLLTPQEPTEPPLREPEVSPPPPVPKAPPSIFPPEAPGRPVYPLADLSVTKSASATTVGDGQVIQYRVTVTDHGPDLARRVEIDDQALGAASVVAVHTPVGHCQIGRPIVCELGGLAVGHSVTITVALRARTPGATLVNRAVAGEASQDPNLADAVSEAAVRVRRPRRPPAVTG